MTQKAQPRSLEELTREAERLITNVRNLTTGGQRIVDEALARFSPYSAPRLLR